MKKAIGVGHHQQHQNHLHFALSSSVFIYRNSIWTHNSQISNKPLKNLRPFRVPYSASFDKRGFLSLSHPKLLSYFTTYSSHSECHSISKNCVQNCNSPLVLLHPSIRLYTAYTLIAVTWVFERRKRGWVSE